LNEQEKWNDQGLLKTQLMEKAGLKNCKMLYIRRDAEELWDALERSSKENIVYVNGPPGTGKSSLVWTWACYRACSNDKIVWMHMAKHDVCKMAIIINKKANFFRFSEKSVDDKLFICLTDLKICTLIIDGVKANSGSRLTSLAYTFINEISKLVFVSSQAQVIAGEETKDCQIFRMDSWTLEEYKGACGNETFFDDIKANLIKEGSVIINKEECITEKFFYAGSCARWFFSMSYDEAIADINSSLNRVSNYEDVLSGLMVRKNRDQVHHLLATFSKKYGIVSEYVARKMLFSCELETASLFLKHNNVRTLCGCLVELIFLFTLRDQCSNDRGVIKVFDKCHTEQWRANSCCIEESVDSNTNSWLVPMMYNQGGYDFYQIENGLLRVVKVTDGKKPYGMKMECVCSLLKKIRDVGCEVNRLDVVFLLPVDTQENFVKKEARFKLGEVTGELDIREYDYITNASRGEADLQKWTKANIRILGVVLGTGYHIPMM
jgi:hypothetical protein